jgi:hypothetical protein
MERKPIMRLSAAGFTFLTVTHLGDARAATMEEAIAKCTDQVRPIVRECVRRKVLASRGSPDQFIPGCKAQVTGQVRNCVSRLIGASELKNNPLDAAREPTSGATAIALAASQKRVVPPRTIADITAILDQEKPDPTRLKKLQTAADGSPSADNGMEAANFYFGRSLVRSELGRFSEAIADSQTAVRLATGRADQLVLNNYRLTVIKQYLAAGQPKLALELLLKMVCGRRARRTRISVQRLSADRKHLSCPWRFRSCPVLCGKAAAALERGELDQGL